MRSRRIFLSFILLNLVSAVWMHIPTRAEEPYSHHAGLVVQFGDGSVQTACVDLGEDEQASGDEVLREAGFDVALEYAGGMGVTICKIDADGCDFPAQPCFCQCTLRPDEACVYWAYHHLVDGAWQYSGFGASNYQVHSGEVEGWAWGEGSLTEGAEPPVMSFDEICAPPATDTPTATNTSIPPSDTPKPATATAIPPSATLVPPTAVPITPSATPVPSTATSMPPLATSPASTATSIASATPTPEPSVWFRVEENPVPAGACTEVLWDTSDVQLVYLDGRTVPLDGGYRVCPTERQTFELTVITNGGEERSYTLELEVTASSPTPQPSPTTGQIPTPLASGETQATPTSIPPTPTSPPPTATATATTQPPTGTAPSIKGTPLSTQVVPTASPTLLGTESLTFSSTRTVQVTHAPKTMPTKTETTETPQAISLSANTTQIPSVTVDTSQADAAGETGDAWGDIAGYLVFGVLALLLGVMLIAVWVTQRQPSGR